DLSSGTGWCRTERRHSLDISEFRIDGAVSAHVVEQCSQLGCGRLTGMHLTHGLKATSAHRPSLLRSLRERADGCSEGRGVFPYRRNAGPGILNEAPGLSGHRGDDRKPGRHVVEQLVRTSAGKHLETS